MTDEQKFRKNLGFTNQNKLKTFYKATDILSINWNKIEKYNDRIKDMFSKINCAVYETIKYDDLAVLNSEIDLAYQTLRNNNLFSHFNNNGRTPEDVYYNWMRGYAICKYFSKALSIVFQTSENDLRQVGDDNLDDPDSFSRTAVADFEFTHEDTSYRLEIQSGYTGTNDLKQTKVVEAQRIFSATGCKTIMIHFDLFNGTAAIIDLLNPDIQNWMTEIKFENSIVYPLSSSKFNWKLYEEPPRYSY